VPSLLDTTCTLKRRLSVAYRHVNLYTAAPMCVNDTAFEEPLSQRWHSGISETANELDETPPLSGQPTEPSSDDQTKLVSTPRTNAPGYSSRPVNTPQSTTNWTRYSQTTGADAAGDQLSLAELLTQ